MSPLLAACPPPPLPVAARPAGAVDLCVASVPAGASVTADGTPRGTAPLCVGVLPGPHRVRLSKAGYFDLEARVEVSPTGGEFSGNLVASH
ncbi:MAG: PEGA domain-containing protein [Deltaproteobacteria bacterium]|nr:PEGA domain-containing protein [Deltaproteobacteria bacterium]